MTGYAIGVLDAQDTVKRYGNFKHSTGYANKISLNILMRSLHGYVTGHRLQTGCPVMQPAIRMCNQDLHRPVRQPGGITAACKRNLHGCATHTQRGCKQI